MTSQEAMDGIQRIQAKFGKRFPLLALMDAWPQILAHRSDCMTRVVGRIVNRSKYMPKMDYLLKILDQLEPDVSPAGERLSAETEARAFFRLAAGTVQGSMKVTALYWLADRTFKPEYALEAHELSQKILAAESRNRDGQNLETLPLN